MIYDEDPLRRRPRESTARRLRHERCVWMARETTKWPATRWPITKIMSSDGCNGNRVPLEMGQWYDFREDVIWGMSVKRVHHGRTGQYRHKSSDSFFVESPPLLPCWSWHSRRPARQATVSARPKRLRTWLTRFDRLLRREGGRGGGGEVQRRPAPEFLGPRSLHLR